MTEFERGIRFVMELQETYEAGSSAIECLQFGNYVISFKPRDLPLSARSAAHLERRIQAAVKLGIPNK